MSSSQCVKCGVLTATLLPSGLCPTCHNLGDPTRVAEHDLSVPDLPTATFAPPAETDTQSFSASEGAARSAPAGPKYILGTLLGSGGMGCVYEAVQTSTGQTVAIKQLKPEALTPHMYGRFITEAQSLAVLKHPNLVCVYDFNPDPNDPQLVMELVDGAPLSKSISKGLLDPHTAARLIADAARGVHLAHSRGIIHRDLKPQNMLLTKEGVIKVSDFGLAKRLDVDDDNTIDGQLVGGTPGFMAPEQVDAAIGPCDQRTDVWGLGATLYAALVGKPPYPTGSKNSVRVLIDPFPPPRSVNRAVPPVLDAIVCKCLEREPTKRYQSAAALADDLDRFRRGESTVAKPLTPRQRVWQRLRRTPRATVAAWAMAGVAVAAILSVAMYPRSVPTPQPHFAGSEPKVNELALLQERYRQADSITIVPKRGLPRWSEWVVGRSDIEQLPNGTGAAHIQPIQQGVTLLYPNPGERFRYQVELRHVSAVDLKNTDSTLVGVVFAHQRTRTATGGVIESFLSVDYCDYDQGRLVSGRSEPQRVHVRSYHYHFAHPGARHFLSKTSIGQLDVTFKPPQLLPGAWRQISVTVTPGELKVLWRADADDPRCEPVELVTQTAMQINDALDLQQSGLSNAAGAPKIAQDFPTTWRPDGGVGVWASNSGLEFRNVLLQRIPVELR